MVEARPVVLPSDARSQLDELLIAEIVQKLFEQLVCNRYGGLSHCCRIAQTELLKIAESRTVLDIVERFELLVRQSTLPAHGRPDVNSEWATD